jgi:non-heme chloroperoxidase
MPPSRLVDLPTGVTLHCAELGDPSGRPVLFLHGFSDSCYSFALLRHLPSAIRALAIMQRGHGDSSRPEKQYRHADLVADAAAFLDALHVQAAVVVGHSVGGTIDQRFAIDHPGRTSAFCLLGAFHSLAHGGAAQQLAGVVEHLEDPVDPEFGWEFQSSTIVRSGPQTFFENVIQESMKLLACMWNVVATCGAEDLPC